MNRLVSILAAACVSFPAAAQQMQPGEWEFTSTMTSPGLPGGPHTTTFRNCVGKEDAADPARWMSRKEQKTDCKVTPGAKTATSYSWKVSCPSQKTEGTGSVRFTGATSMESDMHMTGESRGRKFEMRTKMRGKRLGPCKT